ncbi:hypothetical protein [Pararhizobium haloflavum]|uniref:hypothetical protein n=1 Tax=Pararhizobium haloflavum TaxID=2037914 RepID=UPI000C184047|nr:hypothetical protein [Pararhizobium haloflavum]
MRSKMIASILAKAVRRLTRREPDFIIGGAGRPYMLRWYVIPRNRWFNIYRHIVLRSDDDRALHDHPWWSFSVCLNGWMGEVLPGGKLRLIEKGEFRLRRASTAHRLTLPPDQTCETLFITGPKIREWGFHCPQGWRRWQDFVAKGDSGAVGPGCD